MTDPVRISVFVGITLAVVAIVLQVVAHARWSRRVAAAELRLIRLTLAHERLVARVYSGPTPRPVLPSPPRPAPDGWADDDLATRRLGVAPTFLPVDFSRRGW